ncbi:MAG: helical backbone metal receptor [Gemmatimonadetes bacterium]|nr:helical backbone metal receptor [Gemmatimonadota bacterium]
MAFSGTDIRVAGARRGALLLAALLTTGALASCRPDEDPAPAAISVVDGAGRTVSLDAPAHRIVSMMPSVTEWVIALGAADRLVARTDYDDHRAIAHLPSVGGGLTPSVEWLAERRPDLVIAWPDAPSRSLVARLEALGIPVYSAPSETIAEALDVAADLGRLLGLVATADSAIAAVRAGLDSVRAAVADRPRPDALFLIGLDPVMAAGRGTFLDELLVVAGGRNVVEGTSQRWPQLSLEEIVTRAPDVVIIGTASATDPGTALRGRPGWRDVPAVRHGRVHAVDPNRVNRPGPWLHRSAALLADLLHGEDPG